MNEQVTVADFQGHTISHRLVLCEEHQKCTDEKFKGHPNFGRDVLVFYKHLQIVTKVATFISSFDVDWNKGDLPDGIFGAKPNEKAFAKLEDAVAFYNTLK